MVIAHPIYTFKKKNQFQYSMAIRFQVMFNWRCWTQFLKLHDIHVWTNCNLERERVKMIFVKDFMFVIVCYNGCRYLYIFTWKVCTWVYCQQRSKRVQCRFFFLSRPLNKFYGVLMPNYILVLNRAKWKSHKEMLKLCIPALRKCGCRICTIVIFSYQC